VKRLPTSADELRGLRAARWLRESSKGQADRYGPDAQREQQDRAIERYELVDTGIAWEVAHSGRTIATTSSWSDMLAAAGDTFDVLVVGYVSRFARNLHTAVNARADMHAAGAAILFADERIVTSDEEAWEHWAREAVEAEAYSRRLGKRIREGYAARRRRLGDPGGNPPFGFHRVGPDHVLEPDPALEAQVQRIFDLAAARATDREVSLQTGISIHVIRTTLRSPLYAGRLPDGSPTRFAAPIAPDQWNRVQDVRARRRTRDGRPTTKYPYALTMLRCRACDRRLIGDVGRYRHLELCPEFAAAAVQPKRPVKGQHTRIPGASYRAELYERAIGAVLERVSLGADVIAEIVTDRSPAIDQVALVRVERDRDAALDRYRRDRDAKRLAATMLRLDADELAVRTTAVPALEPAEAVAFLQDLGAAWAAAGRSRRAMAELLFDRIDVLGLRSVVVTPSPTALAAGLADAFRSGGSGYGRGGGI
jgi:DNA invertase Pin-like site-specific DNA recombinase